MLNLRGFRPVPEVLPDGTRIVAALDRFFGFGCFVAPKSRDFLGYELRFVAFAFGCVAFVFRVGQLCLGFVAGVFCFLELVFQLPD